MCRKLVLWVSILAVTASVQAAGFSDDFETPVDYLADGPGAYSGMLTDQVRRDELDFAIVPAFQGGVGLRASLLRVAYGTSKAGLIHLTKQQAAELGAVGIRVNAIAPGPVDTAMAKQVHTADIRADYHDAIPLNRYGTEDEIASGVWFLCSDSASYINGQTLAVDGGFDATGIGLPSLRREPSG